MAVSHGVRQLLRKSWDLQTTLHLTSEEILGLLGGSGRAMEPPGLWLPSGPSRFSQLVGLKHCLAFFQAFLGLDAWACKFGPGYLGLHVWDYAWGVISAQHCKPFAGALLALPGHTRGVSAQEHGAGREAPGIQGQGMTAPVVRRSVWNPEPGI